MNSTQPRIVHMIAGFRRTGKDTLHRDIIYGNIVFQKRSMPYSDYACIPIFIMFIWQTIALSWHLIIELINHYRGVSVQTDEKWLVYSTRSSAIRSCQEHLLVTKDRHQTSFARELKCVVHSRINQLRNDTNRLSDDWFEQNKDQKIRIGSTITTPREMYIIIGESEKKKDSTIWARKCVESINDRPEEIVDITDWRFERELAYMEFFTNKYRIFTTRIYRSSINTPTDSTERDIDHIATDLLLVPSKFDMLCALSIWPQYARYTQIGAFRISAS